MYNRTQTESLVTCLEEGYRNSSSETRQKPLTGKQLNLIMFTSCLCKTMERMISHHLEWVFESQNLLSNECCAFRLHRSTLDHLVHFEYHIQSDFLLRQHHLAVFFELIMQD